MIESISSFSFPFLLSPLPGETNFPRKRTSFSPSLKNIPVGVPGERAEGRKRFEEALPREIYIRLLPLYLSIYPSIHLSIYLSPSVGTQGVREMV